MTFDLLEMLEAVIVHGNDRAASEYLHKSQPSLSFGIKNLKKSSVLLSLIGMSIVPS